MITIIINKKILFGHGTIVVGTSFCALTIEGITPPQEVGESVLDKKFEVLGSIEFKYDDDFDTLMKDLNNITPTDNTIKFRGYLLDFSNYNEKSIEIVKKHLKIATESAKYGLAC